MGGSDDIAGIAASWLSGQAGRLPTIDDFGEFELNLQIKIASEAIVDFVRPVRSEVVYAEVVEYLFDDDAEVGLAWLCGQIGADVGRIRQRLLELTIERKWPEGWTTRYRIRHSSTGGNANMAKKPQPQGKPPGKAGSATNRKSAYSVSTGSGASVAKNMKTSK